MSMSFKRTPFSCWAGAFMLLCFALYGCESSPCNVHMIVPRHFRGAIIVYVNQGDGISVPKRNGAFTIVVPPSGVVRIKNDPFRFYDLTASYYGGKKIPVKHRGDDLKTDVKTVCYWDGGARSNMSYDFIGTREEYLAFMKNVAAGRVDPGKIVTGKK